MRKRTQQFFRAVTVKPWRLRGSPSRLLWLGKRTMSAADVHIDFDDLAIIIAGLYLALAKAPNDGERTTTNALLHKMLAFVASADRPDIKIVNCGNFN